MMTTKERLTLARGVIATPEKWCQGALLRVNGTRCALGALFFAGIADKGNYDADPAYQALCRAMGLTNGNMGYFNDNHTHAEVLEAFDKAIQEAQ
jgi:hypothetical protein